MGVAAIRKDRADRGDAIVSHLPHQGRESVTTPLWTTDTMTLPRRPTLIRDGSAGTRIRRNTCSAERSALLVRALRAVRRLIESDAK